MFSTISPTVPHRQNTFTGLQLADPRTTEHSCGLTSNCPSKLHQTKCFSSHGLTSPPQNILSADCSATPYLSSGLWATLTSYWERIGASPSTECPECHAANHLFVVFNHSFVFQPLVCQGEASHRRRSPPGVSTLLLTAAAFPQTPVL